MQMAVNDMCLAQWTIHFYKLTVFAGMDGILEIVHILHRRENFLMTNKWLVRNLA